jgi:hypothetical protein
VTRAYHAHLPYHPNSRPGSGCPAHGRGAGARDCYFPDQSILIAACLICVYSSIEYADMSLP